MKGLPLVGLGIGVALREVGLDVGDEFVDRGEAPRADHVGGQIGEEPLDQMRCTELGDTPAWPLMLRTLQRKHVFGGRVASVTTRSTWAAWAAGIDGLLPAPGLVLRAVETVRLEPLRPHRNALRRPLQLRRRYRRQPAGALRG